MPTKTPMNPTGTGAFCWYELATNDVAAAKKYYHEIFRWNAKDMAMGPMTYTFFDIDGKTVAGLMELPPEAKKMNVPPHWAQYVQVENIEQSLEKAKKLGGTALTPVMDVGGMGRSAMIKDPTGAAFALWQVTGGDGGATMLLDQTVHGNRCWSELLTDNVDRAGKFYCDLFGWKPQPMKMPSGDYTVFMRGEEAIGGMMALSKAMGPMPPNWMLYYTTDDCDRSVETAKKAKSIIPMPPMDVPEIGRIGVVIDPQGAAFGLVQAPKQ